jgi:hypothetical protein
MVDMPDEKHPKQQFCSDWLYTYNMAFIRCALFPFVEHLINYCNSFTVLVHPSTSYGMVYVGH